MTHKLRIYVPELLPISFAAGKFRLTKAKTDKVLLLRNTDASQDPHQCAFDDKRLMTTYTVHIFLVTQTEHSFWHHFRDHHRRV